MEIGSGKGLKSDTRKDISLVDAKFSQVAVESLDRKFWAGLNRNTQSRVQAAVQLALPRVKGTDQEKAEFTQRKRLILT